MWEESLGTQAGVHLIEVVRLIRGPLNTGFTVLLTYLCVIQSAGTLFKLSFDQHSFVVVHIYVATDASQQVEFFTELNQFLEDFVRENFTFSDKDKMQSSLFTTVDHPFFQGGGGDATFLS